jgi:nifR3 family TIM-barrel protein
MSIHTPFQIGSLTVPHRLIQGPLAGYSCAPFRELFSHFIPPAYAVSEMISAHDVLHKHTMQSRYLYRGKNEHRLCYQIAGNDPDIMAKAAIKLEQLGASLVDINCGCPKPKIRKKNMGSALLEDHEHLSRIIHAVREAITIPLTVKIRIQGNDEDIAIAHAVEDAGADALIVHGRRWIDTYDTPCDYQQIRRIKQTARIPVIANGDVGDTLSLMQAITESQCDAYMIARAGCGKPWLYQTLLTNEPVIITQAKHIELFMTHLHDLAKLEDDYQAVLQSRSLLRYYFKHTLPSHTLHHCYTLTNLSDIERALHNWVSTTQ